jgi:hypothetical protein
VTSAPPSRGKVKSGAMSPVCAIVISRVTKSLSLL